VIPAKKFYYDKEIIMIIIKKVNLCKKNNLIQFTLVELLIVIAIIAILSSMLLPALRQAKESAQKIICISNLNNMGKALGLYTINYNGYSPPIYVNTSNFPGENEWYKNSEFTTYLGLGSNKPWWAPGFGGYKPPSERIIICPSDVSPWSPTGDPWLSYGYYVYMHCCDTNRTVVNLYSIKKPSKVVFCSDVHNARYISYNEYNKILGASYRHRNRINANYGDGHVGQVKAPYSSANLPLRDQDAN
jgi:prepilin-type N-terminal cleavage/methylation domain-containing protein/prepilin-type processing-associated H-X9-DG protein